MTPRLGIAGAAGRMGQMLVAEAAAAGATLIGGFDRTDAATGIARFPSIEALANACDVVLDFTHAATAAPHAQALSAAATPWVLGTTGLDAAAHAAIRHAAARIAIVQATNFSPGVTLLLALTERLAHALPPHLYDAEIIEMHHRQKQDAPSGTALSLGQAVATGRGVDLGVVARTSRSGQVGPRPIGEIGFACLRGGQIVGEHTISFTAGAEQISLTHRAFDRRIFAAGALAAAAWLHGKPPGLYSMRDVLGVA